MEKTKGSFVAVVRRIGSKYLKAPRHGDMGAVPVMTSAANFATYFRPFPKHQGRFVSFGSTRMQSTTAEGPYSMVRKQKKVGLRALQKAHLKGTKITMLTAYDCTMGKLAADSGVDIVLVGDSVANVRLGYDSTVEVTMEEMLMVTRGVRRGLDAYCGTGSVPLLVGDMPFGAYMTVKDALHNATRLLKDGKADVVKLEGGNKKAVETARALVEAGIGVMGHVGLTPQTHVSLGGYRQQGVRAESALQLLREAQALQEAGCFAIVFECVPAEVAAFVTSQLHTPTIGIGAGSGTSGQVLVCDDMLGASGAAVPSFVKKYADLGPITQGAIREYVKEVKQGSFPAPEHSKHMSEKELRRLHGLAGVEIDVPVSTGAAPEVPAVAKATCNADGSYQRTHSRRMGGKAALAGAAAVSVGMVLAHSEEPGPGHARVVHTVADIRTAVADAKRSGKKVGFVPTMGHLHEGHLQLIDAAAKDCDVVVVSIFVNPSQFAAHEDFEQYPRHLDADVGALNLQGKTHLVFAPSAVDMYPKDPRALTLSTAVVPRAVVGAPEDAQRPHFFTGVATVCSKLFNIVQPDAVFFGQKDAVQCVVIRNLIEDLSMPIEFNVVPTARASDGLALSSRNAYLTPDQRARAPVVHRALRAGELQLRAGNGSVSAEKVTAAVREVLESENYVKVQYVDIAGFRDMKSVDTVSVVNAGGVRPESPVIISVGLTMGEGDQTVRLIDNIVVQ
mmetsp:Transcript_17613/g.40553  ORF Transcript_17613/g.40553 Transcript_17613/m.40553 type:complete len:731 (+) Transcript_17613:102-2294(+)